MKKNLVKFLLIAVICTVSIAMSVGNAFAIQNSQSVVVPYWQADAVAYTFMAVSHPNLSGMASQVGVVMTAKDNAGATATTAEFTVSADSAQKVFIIGSSGGALRTAVTALQSGGSVVALATADKGNIAWSSNVSSPVSSTNNRDITNLSFWGAVVIASTTTGFAMEFVGDVQDSRAWTTGNVSGVN